MSHDLPNVREYFVFASYYGFEVLVLPASAPGTAVVAAQKGVKQRRRLAGSRGETGADDCQTRFFILAFARVPLHWSESLDLFSLWEYISGLDIDTFIEKVPRC